MPAVVRRLHRPTVRDVILGLGLKADISRLGTGLGLATFRKGLLEDDRGQKSYATS